MAKIEIEATELDELRARVAELEKAQAPAAPFKSNYVRPRNPVDRLGMSKSARDKMAEPFDAALVEGLRSDAFPNASRSSPGQPEVKRGSGWVDPAPLSQPPGISLIDGLCDAQDAQDRADLARRLARSKE